MPDPITVTDLNQVGRSNAPDPRQPRIFVTYNADFSVDADITLDFTLLNQQQQFGVPRALFMDNGSNPTEVQVYVSGTDQFFTVPAYAQGVFKLDAADRSRFQFTTVGGATDQVTITIYNWDVAPSVWYRYGANNVDQAQQVWGTIAEGDSVAAEASKNPVYIGGIDRATGLFRGVSVDATGRVNVNAIVDDSTPIDVAVTGDVLIDNTIPLNVAVTGDVLIDDTVPVDVNITNDYQGAYTDRSIANLSGASEQLMAANANRRILVISNVGATSVGLNMVGGAAAIGVAGTITLLTNERLILYSYPPTGAINVIGTAAADITAYEG